MRILEEKVPSGSLHKITFLSDGETMDDFKQAIKGWMRSHHPEIGWEEFFNRIERLDRNSLELNME